MVNHKSNLCAHRSFANNMKAKVPHFGVNNNLLINKTPYITILVMNQQERYKLVSTLIFIEQSQQTFFPQEHEKYERKTSTQIRFIPRLFMINSQFPIPLY